MNSSTPQPTPPLRCRPMAVADLPQVTAIEDQVFPAPRSHSFYTQEVTQNRYAHYWVLHPAEEATVTAYGGYWLLGEDAHVVVIAVAPAWQRLGLGEWLMLELCATAWEQDALRVTLEMRVSNQAAAALYAKLGFQEVGIRKRYYRESNEDARVLSLEDLQAPATQQRLQARLATLRQHFQPR